MGTRSKQSWRSRGRGEMDAEVADRGQECFCHTSRASGRRWAEHASHWVCRCSSLPEIPSGNPSPKWKEDQGWWTWRVWCTQLPVLNAQQLMLERLKGCWEFISQSTEGQSRTRIIRMELSCMSKRLRIYTTNWQEAKILGREDNWGRRVLLKPLWSNKETNDEPGCWSDFGSIADPLCSLRKRQSRDQKCYVRRSNPYFRRTSFGSTSTCWWWP